MVQMGKSKFAAMQKAEKKHAEWEKTMESLRDQYHELNRQHVIEDADRGAQFPYKKIAANTLFSAMEMYRMAEPSRLPPGLASLIEGSSKAGPQRGSRKK
jgi:hypothetical protein